MVVLVGQIRHQAQPMQALFSLVKAQVKITAVQAQAVYPLVMMLSFMQLQQLAQSQALQLQVRQIGYQASHYPRGHLNCTP